MSHTIELTDPKKIREAAQKAADKIIFELPSLEFDEDYLLSCIEEAIWNTKKTNNL